MFRTNLLFYVLFLSQMCLISFYFPRKILARMRFVLETYPPSEYPKLYPRSADFYRFGHRTYQWINRAIFGLGFVFLFIMIFLIDHSTFADDGYISEFWPALYGMIQFIPGILLEFTEFNQFKIMRDANKATTRKAILRPRRLFDYITPFTLALVVATFLGAVFLDLYVHDFIIAWENDGLQRALVLTGTILFMAAVGAWTVYGRKPDPHQDFGDRTRQIKASLRSMAGVSIALSVYFSIQAVDDVVDISFMDASLMSLYFQAIVLLSIGHLLNSLKLEDINFNVYRNDAAVS